MDFSFRAIKCRRFFFAPVHLSMPIVKCIVSIFGCESFVFFSFWFLLCRFYMSRFCSIVASFIIDHTWMCTYAYANQQMANQFWLFANGKSSTSKRWHIYTQIDHQYEKKDNIYLNRFENSSGNLILSNEKLSST